MIVSEDNVAIGMQKRIEGKSKILMLIPKIELGGNGILAGGSANTLRTLCEALHYLDGNLPDVLTSLDPDKHSTFRKYLPRWANFHVLPNRYRAQTVAFGIAYLLRSCLYVVQKRLSRPSLVHGHSGFIAYTWVTLLIGRILRVPAIHTIYCPIEKDETRWGAFRRSKLAFPMRRLDRVVALSKNIAESLRKCGVVESRIAIIPPSVDVWRFHPNIKSDCGRYGIPVNKRLLLFVGNLMPAKGLDILLQALPAVFQRFPNVELVVTLELHHKGFEEKKMRCEEMIRELGIKKRVHFLGLVEDMPSLMRGCEVMVVPYRNTQGPSDYPVAMMEAMASGIPVVATKVGGIEELFSRAEVGCLVDPESPNALAVGISRLLSDRSVAKRCAENARTVIAEHYSLQSAGRNYWALYKSVLEERGRT